MLDHAPGTSGSHSPAAIPVAAHVDCFRHQSSSAVVQCQNPTVLMPMILSVYPWHRPTTAINMELAAKDLPNYTLGFPAGTCAGYVTFTPLQSPCKHIGGTQQIETVYDNFNNCWDIFSTHI